MTPQLVDAIVNALKKFIVANRKVPKATVFLSFSIIYRLFQNVASVDCGGQHAPATLSLLVLCQAAAELVGT